MLNRVNAQRVWCRAIEGWLMEDWQLTINNQQLTIPQLTILPFL